MPGLGLNPARLLRWLRARNHPSLAQTYLSRTTLDAIAAVAPVRVHANALCFARCVSLRGAEVLREVVVRATTQPIVAHLTRRRAFSARGFGGAAVALLPLRRALAGADAVLAALVEVCAEGAVDLAALLDEEDPVRFVALAKELDEALREAWGDLPFGLCSARTASRVGGGAAPAYHTNLDGNFAFGDFVRGAGFVVGFERDDTK